MRLAVAVLASLIVGCDGSRNTTLSAPSTAIFGPPEKIGYSNGDDWEPAMTADNFGHLYVAFAHASLAQERRGIYHTQMLVQRSDDAGTTWNTPVAVATAAPIQSEGQFDPWFTLAPDGQTLSFGFLQGYPDAPVDIVSSTNFGATWSAPPRSVSRLAPPLDKVVLVSRGSLMAVGYTDYHSHIVASVSINSGITWTTHIVAKLAGLTNSSQVLVSGGGIDSESNIYFTWDAVWSATHKPAPAAVWITKSANLGATWTTTNLAYSGLPPSCTQCQDKWFFAPQINMQIGSDDAIYAFWNATAPSEHEHNGGLERVYFAKSADHGKSFSTPADVSDAPRTATHCFPAVVSGPTAGDVRLAWMDTRTGSWNVYYKYSTNGGESFSGSSTQLSSGPAADFGIPYGDYMQMAVDVNNMTHAAWGEDTNQKNPGNIWIVNQTR
ncbi:MAG: exo-alpha-sialidase [Candidatus Eremiobacteraeota bacterium]|nr:exo-alpha-sialidase [Candidatus Eremiobacteraeota bacterium]